ncbi:hypothetical protein C8J57DRAFT_1446565 [Mycena rebaudengoi]|nr:hypothetical protein C8J57DRAFT_1446565 [Mycena rebaudengoi]
MSSHWNLTIQTLDLPASIYSDSRTHPPQGPNVHLSANPSATRNVRLTRATPSGGSLSKSEDGLRCAVAGTEFLRIMRVSNPDDTSHNAEHRSITGAGGYRLDASRNMWEGSGLKTDSANTDVAWCHGLFNNKILTSARNGDLIMWDLNKSGPSKFERRAKDHTRSVHKLAVSHIVHHYCITGSADGDLRVWDIRDMQKSIMRIHHATSVRGVAFSPSPSLPLLAVVGLDNGSIYRWELRMGQRGLLDRLPVAHTASVTSLDWYLPDSDVPAGGDGPVGLGWIVSAGLDRCVKIWDLSQPNSSTNAHIPHKPKYTLHPSFPVRRVLWRPGYGCEVAVVSNANAEFGSSNFSELAGPNPGPTYASALGGGSTKAGNGSATNPVSGADNTSKQLRERVGGSSGIGDAVEIWDVRRGWIAKWTVRGSAVEGGVTDIAFRDSHALWATHSSGTFSQIDLRDATKPIDAIPRVAAAWEASGSVAFVAEQQVEWEVPYDDIRPGFQPTLEERRKRKVVKSIGDEPCGPRTQAVATYVPETSLSDVDSFTRLAKAYVFDGEDRIALCEMNAQVGTDPFVQSPLLTSGKDRVAQMWLLLASSLTSLVPELPPTPPQSPPAPMHNSLPGSIFTSAAISSNYSFPPTPGPSTANPGRPSSKSSPRETRSSSVSRKLTPTSSNASSPRLVVSSLPPVTPRPPSQSAYMGRRPSGDSGLSRRPPSYRRMSMSTSLSSTSGASPNNTRHIGEGALDDSDSSSSGSGASTGDLQATKTVIPLSRIAGQQYWAEDEAVSDRVDDDTSSPSPMSTDTDKSSDEAGDMTFKSPRRRQKSKSSSRRQSSTRLKSRSRSSTLASLAAPTLHTLARQSSHSSILTVTAGETPFQDITANESGVRAEETLRDFRAVHRRQKSQAVSEFLLDQKEVKLKSMPTVDDSKLTERRMEFVNAEEDSLRDATWEILREAFEDFANDGDVQTCAMLAAVAPQELRLGPKRILRFLESYTDLLSRLQLYTSAAYLRKFCQSEDIRNVTLIETQIHTSCGKCRKPLVVSAGTPTPGKLVNGGFAYCMSCRTSCVTCAICRLPVRALLFQCSICHHGGHQACYRRYYMQHPMVSIPATIPLLAQSESRGRTRDRTADDETPLRGASQDTEDAFPVGQTNKRFGHRCVSGCGHWCWAANDNALT